MNKYIKIFNKGYEEGIIDAFNDIKNNKIKEFKLINDLEIKSKLYDLGYIKGYKKYIYHSKNSLLINK